MKYHFSASDPSLGYLHQLRYGLFLLLRNRDLVNPVFKLEAMDDIVLEDEDSTVLIQSKHHTKSVVNLTDASPDFWKSLRVWSDNIKNKIVNPESAVFCLVTTSKVGESSYLKCFCEGDSCKAEEIIQKMETSINKSKNADNQIAYAEFSSLDTEQQISLINSIKILDSSISIEETLSMLKKELYYVAPVDKIDLFSEYLEGWWLEQCIEILLGNIDSISSIALQRKITDIRDSFQKEDLPIDFADPLQIDDSQLSNFEDRIFIKQLKIIAIKSNGIRSAISDFRRAFEQRSKWLREDLTDLDELEGFEKKLFDSWQNIFSLIKDESDGMDAKELMRLGSEFYKRFYIDNAPQIKIRPRFSSEYLTRGSAHMLSDKKRIGWHPNFKELLDGE